LRKRPAMWIGDSKLVSTVTAERFGVPPERVACWPLFAVDPGAPQAQAWQPGQTLQLGSLGRLQPAKGYGVLMDALALLNQRGFAAPVPFEISIAGDGGERERITRAAQRAGFAGLRLVGFHEQPLDFLAGLHLYLQPSIREGMCIGMHEAMQAGLPVIASTVGQMPYTLEAGRSGWLVPPGDVNALADALAAALADPGRLAAMGQAARARVLPLFSGEAFRQAGESVLDRLRARSIADAG
jgi:glycosyltransferase involved in cell wall biosynthesis